MPNADQYEQPEERAFPDGTIQALMQEAAPDPREHREDMYRIKEFADLLGDAEHIVKRVELLRSLEVLSETQADALLDCFSSTLQEKLNL